jgi:hypothetical protein
LRDDRDRAAAVPTGGIDGGLFFNTLIFYVKNPIIAEAGPKARPAGPWRVFEKNRLTRKE